MQIPVGFVSIRAKKRKSTNEDINVVGVGLFVKRFYRISRNHTCDKFFNEIERKCQLNSFISWLDTTRPQAPEFT